MSMQQALWSDENPIANPDQRDLEARALSLMAHPELRQTRDRIAQLWRAAVSYPCRDQMDEFEDMVTEQVFWHALYAANGDPGDPRVLRVNEPPLRSFGRDLPGSRWGGDCPDFIYRMIPIMHGGRYEVRAQPSCANPPMANYVLMGRSMSPPTNIMVLDDTDMDLQDDGTLVLTIDDTCAAGRRNHMRTRPDVQYLLVRDAVTQWLYQTPSRLTVRRIDQPARSSRSDDELAHEAACRAIETSFYAYYITRCVNGQEPNRVSVPVSSAAAGGMPTQWGCQGAIDLGEDEAFIMTVTGASARYRNVQLNDLFFRPLNYWDRSGALNMDQMVADENGRYTYVVSHIDPGVHNWLDTGGRAQTLIGHRWQNFESGAAEKPQVTTRLIKLGQLPSVLGKAARLVSPLERKRQLDDRRAGYQRRLLGR